MNKTTVLYVVALALAIILGFYAGVIARGTVQKETLHTVKQGETLWSIAGSIAREDEDIREVYWNIAQDNNIGGNDNIYPGQKLVIRH